MRIKSIPLFSDFRGFTLIEVMVVVAILGILAAVAIPNVMKFSTSGKTEAGATELHNVQMATNATMVQEGINTIAGAAPFTLDSAHDVSIGSTTVGPFLIGGIASLHGSYTLDATGAAAQTGYP